MKLLRNIAFLFTIVACGGDDAPTPVLLPDGSACTENTECESGICVVKFNNGTEVKGGLCTEDCIFLNGAGTCPDEGVSQACLRYNPTGEMWCFETCATNADCREADGWTCAWVGGDVTAC